MQRVAIVGCGGAGKSTFADEMGRRTGLPVIHLDHIYWSPGWVETPRDEWTRTLHELAAAEAWIMDGNYGGTLSIRFERADTIIVLARSRWLCLFRVLRRTLLNLGRAVQADGCPERFDPKFLRWVWHYPEESRPRLEAALGSISTPTRVVVLRTTDDARNFLAALGESGR